jgi:hypothetical protein
VWLYPMTAAMVLGAKPVASLRLTMRNMTIIDTRIAEL